MNFLPGKKTYIIGILAVLGAIGAYVAGQADLTTTVQSVVAAILAMTIRSGVTTEVKSA